MFFGYAMVKSRILKTEDSKVLSVITLYLIIPCVIINAFQIEYSAAVRDGLILAFAAAFVVHILFIVITKVLGKIFSFNSVERASIIYTNAGNGQKASRSGIPVPLFFLRGSGSLFPVSDNAPAWFSSGR